LQSYSDVHPAGTEAADEGGSTLWIAGLAAALAVVIAIVVIVVRRGRRRDTSD
jgi:ABC-type Fe3+ transport system permease subunit